MPTVSSEPEATLSFSSTHGTSSPGATERKGLRANLHGWGTTSRHARPRAPCQGDAADGGALCPVEVTLLVVDLKGEAPQLRRKSI